MARGNLEFKDVVRFKVWSVDSHSHVFNFLVLGNRTVFEHGVLDCAAAPLPTLLKFRVIVASNDFLESGIDGSLSSVQSPLVVFRNSVEVCACDSVMVSHDGSFISDTEEGFGDLFNKPFRSERVQHNAREEPGSRVADSEKETSESFIIGPERED